MKILHSADLHLDTPFTGRSKEQADYLRRKLLSVPAKLAEICLENRCDLVLLSGDLFDGPWSRESFLALRNALQMCAVPVFISPGNHDYVNQFSPYFTEDWPSNVHIFKNPAIESVYLEELDCRVYGAGFRSMDCSSLLEGFRVTTNARYHIGVLHGDPTRSDSPCCPVTAAQLERCGLDYLALGHIHKQGSVFHGHTLCAWPGCPMGRGFDETGEKGVLLTTVDETVYTTFIPLELPRFYELEASAESLKQILPPVGNRDFYRIALTGEGTEPSVQELYRQYPHFPNLQLFDRRSQPADLWGNIDADTLEGSYFRILRDALVDADSDTQQIITLAAKISRQILDCQEVVLP